MYRPDDYTCGLYVISPESFVLDSFKEQVKKAFSGGNIDVFQLRMKNVPDDVIMKACEVLIPICHSFGAQFILNDKVNLVKKVGADGAHVGIEDIHVKEARDILGKDKTLGVSCYGDVDRAITAAEDGADYVAFGAFYPTTTKTPRAMPTPEILKWWVRNSVVPCVAIGGIKPDNCAPLVKAGADFVAVVTGIWDDAEGPDAAVRKFHNAIHGS